MEQNVYINSEPSAEVTIYQNGTPITLVFDAEFLVWGDLIGNISDQTDLQAELDAKVPYTGATGNVNLGEYGLTTGYVQLDTTPITYTPAVGNIGWNDTVGTIQTTLKGGTSLMVGRDMFERVVNKTGVQLTRAAYQAVRISTAQGQRLGVALAQANNDNNSADTIGLAVETIDVNQEGMIFTVGEITGINTTGSLQGETWADGDVLYLSPTVAGRITNVKPVAPQHLVVIGYVTYAHQNNGKLYVKVMNGWEIGELHDVRITSPTNGQVLKYNSSLGVWENNTDAAGTGTVTQVNATGGTGISVSGSPITTSGTLTITNTAPDQTVVLNSGTGISTSGTYPNFTITNSAPDQTVSLTQGGTTTITGTYPNFTVSSADQYQGTVTSASVVSANGFAGTVANSTTTPAITLSTSVTGLLKGNGTAISAAVAGTDYQAALTNPVTGTGTSGQVSYWTGTTSQSGSNNLFWDSANNRLGVGTNSPSRTLDVNGLAGFTGTTASDGGQLGSELLSSANWTLGAGWTGDFTTGFAHSSGTATLTNTLAAVNGTYYRIQWTVTNRTAGSFTLTFGGYSSGSQTATATVGPRATSTASLVITPTNDFNGTIVFSIKVISASSASIQLRNSSGTVTNEIRNDSSNTNVIIGTNAGSRNLGIANTFIGTGTGQNNTTAESNTFVGRNSGSANTIGSNNSFFGQGSGQNNINGFSNSAVGVSALQNNTTGTNNSAFGVNSLLNNNASNNSAFGIVSLLTNTTGSNNSGFGIEALYYNTSGNSNSGLGASVLLRNTTGSNNIAFGRDAGRYISSGSNLTVANNSVFLGYDTRANADSETNQTVIGYQAIGLGSNTTVIGNSSTTFGRWWGNLLLGTSTNSTFLLDVNGTARIQNDLTISDTRNIILATGTGTKIGTSTSQKLAFYNSAPIVQPTTGVAAATRVSVAGNTVTDADTFDGYTIPQLVKAMRNLGLLA